MQIKIELSKAQYDAIQTLARPDVDAVLFGGSRGPGKTVCGCVWMYLSVVAAIKKYKMRRTMYPPALGLMVRKRSVDFSATTLETWKRIIPSGSYNLIEHKKEIIVCNAAKIKYGGLDNTEAVNKFLGGEYAYIFVDQCEEATREDLGMLRSTLNRILLNGEQVPGKMLLTANPPFCSLRDDFLKPGHNPRNVYIKALPTDNPFIDVRTYVDTLTQAWQHRPEMLRAYLHGEDVDLSGNTIITSDMLSKLTAVPLQYQGRGIVAVDPAWDRPNSDETAIVAYVGNRPVELLAHVGLDTTQTAAAAMSVANKYKIKTIVVDVCGIGAGVYDSLKHAYHCIPCNAGAAYKSNDGIVLYANTKAWLWHTAAQAIGSSTVMVPDDPSTREELTSVTYSVVGGKITMESKDSVRQKLGRSTNRADAVVMAIAYLPQARLTADAAQTVGVQPHYKPRRVY